MSVALRTAPCVDHVPSEVKPHNSLITNMSLLTGGFIYDVNIVYQEKRENGMEEADLQLIRKLIPKDQELKKLWDEHQDLEEKLDQLNKRRYLSSDEELRRKEIQKLKLLGKDRMEEILSAYRDT